MIQKLTALLKAKGIWRAVVPNVGRAAFEYARSTVDVLPRYFGEVEVVAEGWMPFVAAQIKHPVAYETLNDAIVGAEDAAAGLVMEVKPENLFFLFGQDRKALLNGLHRMLKADPFRKVENQPCRCFHSQEHHRGQKNDAENCAVVLCKLADAKLLEPLRRQKKNAARGEGDCCQVTWAELQEFKNGTRVQGGAHN